jgi:hypothetical protein
MIYPKFSNNLLILCINSINNCEFFKTSIPLGHSSFVFHFFLLKKARQLFYSKFPERKNGNLERHNSSINPFMLELFFTRPKFPNDVSFLVFASQYKLVYNQSLQTHRTPGVYPSSADTNLSPKSISETISKTCTCIDECTCRINTTTEYR